MPIITGAYQNNELQVFYYLTQTMKMTVAAACGVMANINKESSFNPQSHGDSYTSYGLCQWHKDRKTNLQNYCKQKKLDYKSVNGQMSFLYYELGSYRTLSQFLWGVANTSNVAGNAGEQFCRLFERPANVNVVAAERKQLAIRYFDHYTRYSLNGPVQSATKIGSEIVRIAREQIGKRYNNTGKGPNNFSNAGLIYYCYNQAGYNLPYNSARDYYKSNSRGGKSVLEEEIADGDLLFYTATGISDHIYAVAIGTREKSIIYVGSPISNQDEIPDVIEEEGLYHPAYILRLVADSETINALEESNSIAVGGGTVEEEVVDFESIVTYNPYTEAVATNLSTVEDVGFDYGYLIDLTQGGEFKFYIPEYSESAGAEWSSVDIIGRSVDIKYYNKTGSRSISVSLELYAGAGLYANGTDVVGMLHKDMYFLKSLEYPDYSNPIVRPPSTVQLILGSATNLVGVVSNVTIEHLKPLDAQNRSMYMKASFTVTQIDMNPPDYSDIRKGNYTGSPIEEVVYYDK